MKHYSIYVSQDMYEYGKLELVKNIVVRDGNASQEQQLVTAIDHFKMYFNEKQYSEMHLFGVNLDPQNGVVEVIMNEYMQHPLRKRIVINGAARKTTNVVKKVKLTTAQLGDWGATATALFQTVGAAETDL